MELKNSKTKDNLMKAFAGESQARNRYNIAGELAKQQKLYVIQDIFDFTANQEKAHAKVFWDLLKDVAPAEILLDTEYPVDDCSTLVKALQAAEGHELAEGENIYVDFARVAKEEGFPQIAAKFDGIAKIEKIHASRFAWVKNHLENNTLYNRAEETEFMCTNCGHIHKGKTVPGKCPICDAEQGYFLDFDKTLLRE